MQTVLHIVCLKFACSVTIASEFMIVSICRKYVVAAAAAFSIHFTPFLLFSCCLVGIRIRLFLYCSLSIYFEICRLVCCVLHTSTGAILHENDTYTTLFVLNICTHDYCLTTLNGFLEVHV